MSLRGYSFRLVQANQAADSRKIGVKLGRYCIGKDISVYEIAQQFDVSRMTIYSWFRDARKSADEVTAMQAFLVSLMGPSVGLGITAAESLKQVKEGHLWRGMETASPAVIKNALKGIRISDTFGEGKATNLKGNVLVDDFGIGEVMGQAAGFAPERLAQRQKANIEMKSMERKIISKRQDLLNAYFMAYDANDEDFINRVEDKIDRFNAMYPDYPIEEETINRSIEGRYSRREEAEETGGMPINKRLLPALAEMGAYGDVGEDE